MFIRLAGLGFYGFMGLPLLPESSRGDACAGKPTCVRLSQPADLICNQTIEEGKDCT